VQAAIPTQPAASGTSPKNATPITAVKAISSLWSTIDWAKLARRKAATSATFPSSWVSAVAAA